VPIIAGLFWKRATPAAAFTAMLAGGTTTLLLTVFNIPLPFGLDPNIYGITIAAICMVVISIYFPNWLFVKPLN